MKEPFLEPVLRKMRIRKVLPTILGYSNCRLLDIGCGWDYRLLRTLEPFICSGLGIDFKVPEVECGRIETKQARLDEKLPIADESVDVVTMLAVLEHLSSPYAIVREIERVLVPGGSLVVTVPSKLSKPVLELLAYRLKLVNEAEIRDHKKYYDYDELDKLITGTILRIERHAYFQFGMNNFCLISKPKDRSN